MKSGRGYPMVLFATVSTVFLWAIHLYLREFLRMEPGDPARLLVTSVLVLCFGWMIFEQVKQSRQLDEFQRQVQYLALGIAFPLATAVMFAIGFFRAEGLLAGLDSRDLFVVMLLSYALGLTIAWKRYA